MGKRTTGNGSESIEQVNFAGLETFVRGKVQSFIQEILEEEVTSFLARDRYERRAGIDAAKGSRNGYGKPRKLSMQSGTIVIQRPRVRDTDTKFESRILPLFARRTEEVGKLLPELYLHGLSKGDFELALRGLLGDGAPLSSASIERLRAKWQNEYDTWCSRALNDREIVYVWADGIYVKAGLEKDKAALLVIIGAMSDGTKEVLAVVPGQRESTASWLEVLRSLRDRGLSDPKLVIGDGHLGIWAAVREIWSSAEEQRCWNHRIGNIVDRVPARVLAEAKEALKKIPYAPTKKDAEKARDAFARKFKLVAPKAVETLLADWDRMVAFYSFPEAHWSHLRTTNVIESPFAAVRLRTDAAKRFKKTENATAMIWRVLRVAEKRFRRINAPELLKEVHLGKKFIDGQPITKNGKAAA